ncbi:DUF934 domain-containing protein [Rhodocyclaceae bacterium]
MANLIKNGDIVANEWITLTLDAGLSPEDVKLPYGNVLLPLAVWRVRKWDLIQRQWHSLEGGGKLGVWLSPDEDPAVLAADLDDLDVVAVRFPAVGDGRGYSIASLLRTRYGFKRELRAIGAVERDYLHFLQRVGFNALEVGNPEEALASLDDFSIAYQPAADQSLPLAA